MAGGSLMQLSTSSGNQDIYLTGNAEVTFFKVEYVRHTNFAMESVECTFNGSLDFGRRVVASIPRNGDAIGEMHIQLDLPALTGTGTQAWTRNIGLVLIQQVDVVIGGITADTHYSQYLHIWQELTQSAEHQDTYDVMIGNTSELTTEAASIPQTTLYIPLRFWFNVNVGLVLPLIALQYHDVKIQIQFRNFSECYVSSAGTVTTPTLTNAAIWTNYYFFDTDERRQFAQIPHEYLIEELQFTGAESFSQTNIKQRLNFNHPCKELIWVSQLAANVDTVANAGGDANRWTDYTNNGSGAKPYNGEGPVVDAKLQLNGIDRFATRPGNYFNLMQPYNHHTRGPATGIYVYSFAINPEEHQPSGTCNFSKIDNSTLNLTMGSSAAMNLYTYTRSYNIGRIMSGMWGKAYSN